MRNEILIKRLNMDDYVHEIVSMHRDIFIGTELFGKLIYFDDAFCSYFEKILSNQEHYIFGIFKESRIHGFVHLVSNSSTLFLNNIYLSTTVRGNGTGSSVLNEIFRIPSIVKKNFKHLELDVLKSNIIARKWYEKLGLGQKSTQNWYYVNSVNKDPELRFSLDHDINGFNGVYIDNNKVATIIDNTCVILHNVLGVNYEHNLPCIIKLDKLPQHDELNFSMFETSIRMRGSIKEVLKNINIRNV